MTMFFFALKVPCSNEIFLLSPPPTALFFPLFLLLITVVPQTRLVHMHETVKSTFSLTFCLPKCSAAAPPLG